MGLLSPGRQETADIWYMLHMCSAHTESSNATLIFLSLTFCSAPGNNENHITKLKINLTEAVTVQGIEEYVYLLILMQVRLCFQREKQHTGHQDETLAPIFHCCAKPNKNNRKILGPIRQLFCQSSQNNRKMQLKLIYKNMNRRFSYDGLKIPDIILCIKKK